MPRYFKILLAIVYLAACAQVSFDLPIGIGIPITGQTFAVIMIGYILGVKDGTLSIILYLLLGIVGFPVYADWSAGIKVIQSGSGGFLIGFVAGAYLCAKMAQSKYKSNFLYILLAMVLGSAVIVSIGLMKLNAMFGFEKALEYGFYPFWIGALIKSFLAAIVVFIYFKFFEKPQDNFANLNVD